jgi:hypothetical protein
VTSSDDPSGRHDDLRVARFLGALDAIETAGDVTAMASLYADDAEVGSVQAPRWPRGMEGAAAFWSAYRDALRGGRSSFRSIVVDAAHASLEWHTAAPDQPPHGDGYDGVTILSFDRDRIVRSWAYFDPKALGRSLMHPLVMGSEAGGDRG